MKKDKKRMKKKIETKISNQKTNQYYFFPSKKSTNSNLVIKIYKDFCISAFYLISLILFSKQKSNSVSPHLVRGHVASQHTLVIDVVGVVTRACDVVGRRE